METSGFYKVDNGDLMYAPNFVSAPEYELNRNLLETYTLPIDGWYWFDNVDDANAFFKIPNIINEQQKPDLILSQFNLNRF